MHRRIKWKSNVLLIVILTACPALTQAQAEKEQKLTYINSHEKSGLFSIWTTGSFFLRTSAFSNFRVRQNPSVPGVLAFTRETLIGYDIGGTVRVSSRFKAGMAWSQMINGAKQTIGIAGFKGPSRPVGALSWYVEPTLVVGQHGRVYNQTGIGWYRFNFSDAQFTFRGNLGNNMLGEFTGDKGSSIGGYIGFGSDLWLKASEFGLWGFRTDLKYHYIPSPDGATFQGTKFSGFRFGFGFSFMR